MKSQYFFLHSLVPTCSKVKILTTSPRFGRCLRVLCSVGVLAFLLQNSGCLFDPSVRLDRSKALWDVARERPVAASGFIQGFEPENLVNATPICWAVKGGGLQWFEVYLDGLADILRFTLTMGYNYQGEAINVYGRIKGKGYQLLHTFKGTPVSEGKALIYTPEQPWHEVEMIRMESVDGPDYLCWNNLELWGRIPGRVPPDFNDCSDAPAIIYYNGKILTMDDTHSEQQAVAIRAGRIMAVGTNEEILALRRAQCGTYAIDLHGLTVLPGFNDSHAHWFSWYGDYECSATGDTLRYPPPPLDDKIKMLVTNGWTSFSDMAFGFPVIDRRKIDSAIAMDNAGRLKVRVTGYWGVVDTVPQMDEIVGYANRRFTGKVKTAGIKLYIDHPLGISCCNHAQEDVNNMVRAAHDYGFQIAAHAVSESGVEQILTAYETVLPVGSNDGMRYRIEHAVKVSDDQLDRMKRRGIIASIQLIGPGDWPAQPSFQRYLQNPNPEYNMRWKDFMNARSGGLKVVGSCDAPYNESFCDYNPFRVIYQAVTRNGYLRNATYPWELNQRLDISEAIELLTKAGAYATFDEHDKGTIEPGKFADLVIVSDNPLDMAATPERLLDIQVYLTMVGAEVVYRRPGHEGLATWIH